MATVPEDDVPDLADPLAVDENPPGSDPVTAPGSVGVQLEHVTILEQVTALGRDPDLGREADVSHQMAILAVHGHEVPRADEIEHQLQLFLRGMSGDVHARDPIVVDDRTSTV